jgi:endonuclease-3
VLLRRFPSLEAIAGASLDELREALRPFGLHGLRARMLRELAARILSLGGLRAFLKLGPREAREILLSVPGIGEKTADIILAALFGEDVFVVDTHILRIARRLELVSPGTSIYEARRLIEPLIPRGKRLRLHLALIKLGREICRPRKPRCNECPLREICSYAASALNKA